MLENLLGIEPVAPGEDTRWQMRYSLGWPDWLLVIALVVGVALVIAVYLRENPNVSRASRLFLAAIRLAILGLILLMLGGLELLIDRTGLPYLVFLIDDSESMTIRDAPGASADGPPSPPRLGRIQDWLMQDDGAPFRELTSRHKVQIYAASSSARLVGTAIDHAEADQMLDEIRKLEAKGTESRLGSNLRSVLNGLRGTPPSAVVYLTDGVTTQGEPLPQSAQYAARKNIPLYTIGVGDPGEIRDLEIRDILVDETVFVGDAVTFQVKLGAQGLDVKDAKVQLIRKSNGETIDEKKAEFSGGKAEIELGFRPTEPGADVFEVLVVPDEKEISRDNNRVSRRVEAIKEKVRVLYVESYPRYEFRYLKTLLEREETVELRVLLADADPEFLEEDRVAVGYFPTTRDELYEYDVVILGDVAPSLFSAAQLDHLRDFVRVKGGGVLFIAGPQASPRTYRDTAMEELLPVDLTSASSATSRGVTSDAFFPLLTIEGKASPLFRFGQDESESSKLFSEFPGIYWHAGAYQAKPAAVVLAEHPDKSEDGSPIALVATQFFGAGRTLYQGFTGTWRWRRLTEDLYFARYWIQAIRLLSRSKLLGKNKAVELFADRKTYRRGDPVQIRVRLLDESLLQSGDGKVTVSVDRADGASRTIELVRRPDGQAVFEGVFVDTEDGAYRVRLSSPLVDKVDVLEFAVVPPPGELDRVQMNESELRAVAEMTGGAYHRLEDAKRLWRELPTGRKVALHTDPPIELWNRWPVLAALAGLLALEWILRKRRSML